jgi:hypothetical protein
MSTPSPRITRQTSGAMRACLDRSCRCPWHARGACQTRDTPHSALPRQGIGSSTDAVSLDGSSLISLEPHEGERCLAHLTRSRRKSSPFISLSRPPTETRCNRGEDNAACQSSASTRVADTASPMHNYGARVQVDHRLTMSETPSGHCAIGYRAARHRRASARLSGKLRA